MYHPIFVGQEVKREDVNWKESVKESMKDQIGSIMTQFSTIKSSLFGKKSSSEQDDGVALEENASAVCTTNIAIGQNSPINFNLQRVSCELLGGKREDETSSQFSWNYLDTNAFGQKETNQARSQHLQYPLQTAQYPCGWTQSRVQCPQYPQYPRYEHPIPSRTYLRRSGDASPTSPGRFPVPQRIAPARSPIFASRVTEDGGSSSQPPTLNRENPIVRSLATTRPLQQRRSARPLHLPPKPAPAPACLTPTAALDFHAAAAAAEEEEEAQAQAQAEAKISENDFTVVPLQGGH